MTKSIDKKRFSQAWIIVVACMLIQAIPFGVASNIQPQFVSYVVSEKGFTLAGFSLIFTLGTVASAVASPFIGVLFNKVNTRLMFLLGAILSGGGFLAFSMCNQLWQFYAVAAIVQIGTAAISSIGVPLVINRWFDEESKGKAMGIAFAGSGLGNIFLQQLSVNWIEKYGYAQAYQKFALLSVVVGAVVSLLLISTPKKKSETVVENVKENENNENVEASEGYTFKEASKLKAYWIFAVAFVFVGIYVSALATQYSAYLKVQPGFPVKMLGAVGSAFAACSLIGNLIGGTLYDKLGTTKTTIAGFILAVVSCASLMFAPKIPALAYVYGVTKGLSVFAYILAPSMLTGALFGKKDFGSILGITQVFFALGFAFGSAIFGMIVDNAGYTVAWSFIMVSIFVAYSMLLVAIGAMKKTSKSKNNKKIA